MVDRSLQSSLPLQGGCACGELRYEAGGALADPGFCHCTLCRRTSGAPVLAYGSAARSEFRWIQGAPQRHRSSSRATRTFCGACGTHLTMEMDHAADVIDVTLGSLDDPSRVAPAFHIWTEQQLPWLQVADGLPRHLRTRPGMVGG